MRPKTCPECGGYCWPNEHTCPDCSDGYAPTPKPPEPLERTAEEERTDVIAYLAHAATFQNPILPMNRYIETLRENIENGEHVGWSKDDTSRKAILDRESYRP